MPVSKPQADFFHLFHEPSEEGLISSGAQTSPDFRRLHTLQDREQGLSAKPDLVSYHRIHLAVESGMLLGRPDNREPAGPLDDVRVTRSADRTYRAGRQPVAEQVAFDGIRHRQRTPAEIDGTAPSPSGDD